MEIKTAVDIFNAARGVYLNDTSAARFTDAKLFPHLKVAQGMLETALEQNGVACKKAISPIIQVATGVTLLPSIPTDFLWPLKMEERSSGATSDLFVPMVNRNWLPSEAQGSTLKYWVWKGFMPEISLLGATTDREVLLYYQQSFPALNVNTDVVYSYAQEYYEAKVAYFAHLFQEQSPTLAAECERIAQSHLDEIINIMVKKGQALPVRRRPFRTIR